MWRTPRLMGAIALALAFGFFPTTSAHADEGPNSEEWWFPSWRIQDQVWPITKGQGVTVAVIDTGVNASLPDLAGVVLPGRNIQGAGDGRTDVDAEPDSKGHGTSMAITIAGQGGKNHWLGIAPGVKILPIVSQGLDEQDLSSALHYAVDQGAKVINISQGADAEPFPDHCPVEVQQAIAYAVQHDAIVVVAAGNTGNVKNEPDYPASCAGVVAAGAIGPDLQPWTGTQRQSYVTVSAPGYKVGLIGRDGVLYHNSWGTSIATAFTSAEAALVRSKYPHMSAREVVQRIIATAKSTGTPGHQDPATGYGFIRVYRAVTEQVPSDAPNPVYEAFDKWKASQGATASPSAPASAGSNSSSGSSGGEPFGLAPGIYHLLLLGGGLLVIGGTVVAILLSVRKTRNRPGSAVPPPGVPQQFPPFPPSAAPSVQLRPTGSDGQSNAPSGPPAGFGGPTQTPGGDRH